MIAIDIEDRPPITHDDRIRSLEAKVKLLETVVLGMVTNPGPGWVVRKLQVPLQVPTP